MGQRSYNKPLVGYIAGLTAPKGKRMGHAGAIINTAGESAAEKVAALKACGATLVPHPSAFGTVMQEVLKNIAPPTP